MGCGSSNTLENSEYKNLENQERTLFNKTVANDAILKKEVPEYENGVSNIDLDSEVKEAVAEIKKNIKTITLSDEEMINAISYRKALLWLQKKAITDYKESGEMIEKVFSNLSQKESEAAAKLYVENLGVVAMATGVTYENDDDKSKGILAWKLHCLKYSTELKFDTALVMLNWKMVENPATIKSMGAWMKHSTTLRNITFAVEPESSDPVPKSDQLGFLFDGAALSKSLVNFSFVYLNAKQGIPVNDLTVNSIKNFIQSSQKLKSFALSGIVLSDLQRPGLMSAIAKNPSINILALQFVGDTDKQVLEIAEKLSSSKAKLIGLGIKEKGTLDLSKYSRPERIVTHGYFDK